MQVNELMTDRVVTIDADNSLKQAASRMYHYSVGSIVVLNDGELTGILTQSDVMEAGAATDEPFSRLPVTKVMTTPVVTVKPTMSVQAALDVMKDKDVKHLPVTADGELHGMLTSSDIVYRHEELIHEVEALRETRPATDPEQDLDD